MHLITGIDCPFYFLVLEFPQNPAKELLDGVGEGLWACVSALADSFVGELKKAHPLPLAVQSLPETQAKLSSFHKRSQFEGLHWSLADVGMRVVVCPGLLSEQDSY